MSSWTIGTTDPDNGRTLGGHKLVGLTQMTVECTDEGAPFFNKSVGPAHPEEAAGSYVAMFAAAFRGTSCQRVRSGLPGSRIAGSVNLGHETNQNARKRTVARNRLAS